MITVVGNARQLSVGNFVRECYRDLNVFLHYRVKIKIKIATGLDGVSRVRPRSSSCHLGCEFVLALEIDFPST